MATIKFYSVKSRKSVEVDVSKVKKVMLKNGRPAAEAVVWVVDHPGCRAARQRHEQRHGLCWAAVVRLHGEHRALALAHRHDRRHSGDVARIPPGHADQPLFDASHHRVGLGAAVPGPGPG